MLATKYATQRDCSILPGNFLRDPYIMITTVTVHNIILQSQESLVFTNAFHFMSLSHSNKGNCVYAASL